MKILEAIKQSRENRMSSCGLDTTHKTERHTWASISPDERISVGIEGNISNYAQGMQILIGCRHNGTKEDMLKAFEEAQEILKNAIM